MATIEQIKQYATARLGEFKLAIRGLKAKYGSNLDKNMDWRDKAFMDRALANGMVFRQGGEMMIDEDRFLEIVTSNLEIALDKE